MDPAYAQLVGARTFEPGGAEFDALCLTMTAEQASAWRDETLRILFRRALRGGRLAAVEVLEPALSPLDSIEERLLYLVEDDPLAAVLDDRLPLLTSIAKLRVMGAAALALPLLPHDEANDLARGLHEALVWYPACVAFICGRKLAELYGCTPQIELEHLARLADLPTTSAVAQADLLRVISAALIGRGAIDLAADLQAQACSLTTCESDQTQSRLRGVMQQLQSGSGGEEVR